MLFNHFYLLVLISVVVNFNSKVSSTGTASWYYKGTKFTSNSSVSLNVGDSFLVKCAGIANRNLNAFSPASFIIMFATSSTANPSLVLTYTSASSASSRPLSANLAISSGTLIYHSVTGVEASYSHWIISNSIIIGSISTTSAYAMTRGNLFIYIPYLISTDAGTMYCVYADGYSETNNALAFSSGLTLSLSTNSKAESTRYNSARNRFLEYSIAFLSSMKIIF